MAMIAKAIILRDMNLDSNRPFGSRLAVFFVSSLKKLFSCNDFKELEDTPLIA